MTGLILHELKTDKYSPEIIAHGKPNTDALNAAFQIPVYQRLYTWEKPEVKRLLSDLWDAFTSHPDKEYFIGSIVVSPIENGKKLELIDGQQRMTTLWLIASVIVKKFKKPVDANSSWKSFLTVIEGDTFSPRLDFAGREKDKASLEKFIASLENHPDDYQEENRGWLSNPVMAEAIVTINDFFKHGDGENKKSIPIEKLHGFSDYIWKHATFVITQLHPNSNNNEFFDSMNSRGIQLEKHEILKTRLLLSLDENERFYYAKAWDLCSDIHGFIEPYLQKKLLYGLKDPNKKNIVENFITALQERNKLNKKSSRSEKKSSGNEANLEDFFQGKNEKTLSEILDDKFERKSISEISSSPISAYKSPVSFPVFLLHVLRIFVKETSSIFNWEQTDKEISLDDKNLIKSFDKYFKLHTEQEPPELQKELAKQKSRLFIECLLGCRLLLDNFVIKGQRVEGSDHANWRIWSCMASKDNKIRQERSGKEWASITMLQTMMYFSRDLHAILWLTKVLENLRGMDPDWKDKETNNFLEKLRQQDTDYVHERFGIKSLREIIGAVEKQNGLGTATPHYWFYKLEYCLWEIWFNEYKLPVQIAWDNPPGILKKSAKSSFRMRHVTSVEHVSPQNGEHKTLTDDSLLHRFGNLALISVGANSSYSAKDPRSKTIDFTLKLEKGFVESLKLAHIFDLLDEDSVTWDNDAMRHHESAMVSVLKAFHPELECDNNKEAGAGI
jgi:uncharacterized protein with ParB-like and HNH nuclease domain